VKLLLRALALAHVVGATAATVATVPASAQSYKVTVQLADGTLESVVLDLPEGTTVDQLAGYESLPGTPVSVEAIVAEIAQEEQPPPEFPPPAEPTPEDPPPAEPPPPESPPNRAGKAALPVRWPR
jgi:hypothetical protein